MNDESGRRWPSRRRATPAAPEAAHEAHAVRAAGPLRAPELAEPTFAARVMGAVRAQKRGTRGESAGAPSPWWRGSVAVRVTPLRGLALAAGLAAVALVSADLLAGRGRATGASRDVAARHDTVYVVRFVFAASHVSSVALVGDFNRWDVNAHRLAPAGAGGVWTASVPLPPGRHEYAFVIDGTRWVADPTATASLSDEFGGESSVITVGGPWTLRSS